MIVCHCKGISDKTIKRAVREGARTLEEVGVACRAGTECGGCLDTIRWLIQCDSRSPAAPAFGTARFAAASLAPDPGVP